MGYTFKLKTLVDLAVGESAVIEDIVSNDTQHVKRLHGLGLRKGKVIKVLRKGLTGSPLHVKVNTTELAIRQKDAENIRIL